MPRLQEIYDRWFGGAKADPAAMHTPVYPLVHSAEVTLDVHTADGMAWEHPVLSAALAEFGRYLSGKLTITIAPPLPLPTDSDGMLTWEQAEKLTGHLPMHGRGPSAIAMVLLPRIRDRRSGSGYCLWRPGGSHCIVIQSCPSAGHMRLPWPASWRRYAQSRHLLHELCHALHLPAGRQHRAAQEHCTNASCVLFPQGNYRVWAKALIKGFAGPTLCAQCLEELQQAKAAPARPGAAPDAVLDWYTHRIELNPHSARAYAYRGEEHHRRGRLDEAIVDLTRAIELDAQTAAWYSFRGSLYMKTNQPDSAIDDLRRCLALQPDNRFAQTNLAMLLPQDASDDT